MCASEAAISTISAAAAAALESVGWIRGPLCAGAHADCRVEARVWCDRPLPASPSAVAVKLMLGWNMRPSVIHTRHPSASRSSCQRCYRKQRSESRNTPLYKQAARPEAYASLHNVRSRPMQQLGIACLLSRTRSKACTEGFLPEGRPGGGEPSR